VIAALCFGVPGVAFANCAPPSGSTIVCDGSAPNPFTNSINADPTTGSITIPPSGATVIVQPGAAIAPGFAAIQVRTNSTVTNSGSISTTGVNAYGIWTGDPNNTTATTAGFGNTLVNNGSITTTGSNSVGLFARSYSTMAGSTLINNGTITTSGSISGTSNRASSAGIRAETVAPSTIVNTGTVTATGAFATIGLYGVAGNGVEMDGPGTFTNAAGASVSSANAYGFYGNGAMANGITVDNAGTISGGLAAIFFGPALSNNTVMLEPTSIETGSMDGGSSSVNSSLIFNGLRSTSFSNPIPDWQLVTLQNGAAVTFTAPSYALQNLDLMAGTSATFSTPQITIGGTVTDNGSLTFASPSVITIAATIEGSGMLTQDGAGTLILNGQNTYTGATTVQTGTLVVGDPGHTSAALSGGGPITVASGATLGGFGSVTGAVTNNGTVAAGNATPGFASAAASIFTINGDLRNNNTVELRDAGARIANTLLVNGNYSAPTPAPNQAPSAKLNVNTFLNAGGPLSNQTTDRLLVAGNATGTTGVQVTNVGGPGTVTGVDDDEGISLVQVGGTSSPGAFVLPRGYVTGGTPFQYHLNAFGPGSPLGPADQAPGQDAFISDPVNIWDFRLQSAFVDPGGEVPPQPPGSGGVAGAPPGGVEGAPPVPPPLPPDARRQVAPQVPAYLSTARGLFQAGLLDIATLHQRLGEIRDDQTLNREGTGEFFIRAYGGLFNYTTNRSFTNFGFNFNEDYAAVQFGGNYDAIDNEYGTLRVGLAGNIGRMWLQPFAIDGMSKALFNTQNFAGIATWQDRAGWYVDGIVMGGLFDGRYTTPQAGQATGMNGTSVAVSVETGYPFPLPWELSFEPQAQLVWQHLNFQNRTDIDEIDVNLGSPDQVTARVGFRLKRPFQTEGGMLFTPYLKANVLQGIGSSGDAVLGGVSFETGNVGTALQVGAGVTGTLTRNLSLYGDVSWQSQVGNGGGFRGWIFNGGLRYSFGAPRPAPALVPAAMAAPAPQAARSYLVFFDWDKATLTDRARQIIREAADSSTHVQYTRIEVNGHTDTSGTPGYNMSLSLRRAHAVAGELVRDGVPANAITIRGFGQTDLLVPTGPGVREPQNRRVEIVLK